jgi:hypothetical protein
MVFEVPLFLNFPQAVLIRLVLLSCQNQKVNPMFIPGEHSSDVQIWQTDTNILSGRMRHASCRLVTISAIARLF